MHFPDLCRYKMVVLLLFYTQLFNCDSGHVSIIERAFIYTISEKIQTFQEDMTVDPREDKSPTIT